MPRRKKVLLAILIPIIVISFGIGVVYIGGIIRENKISKLPAPSVDFPVEDPSVVHIIWGYGDQGGDHHNGIDFGCNTSVNIVAWCDMEVEDIDTFYNERGGHWQTNVGLKFNDKYSFVCAFEPWALNETYAYYQEDAISVEVGQIVTRGEVIGELLNYGDGTHIHFGMYNNTADVCAYQYFSETAKAIFDPIWDVYGWGDDFWYQ
ncbi:MAG: hypothetical protein ACTSRE_01245 [Promethearchaeota archaeon]